MVALLKRRTKLWLEDIDESIDEEALVSRVLTTRLQAASEDCDHYCSEKAMGRFLIYMVRLERIPNEDRAAYRTWLDKVIDEGSNEPLTASLRAQPISVLVATAVRFERRAQLLSGDSSPFRNHSELRST